MNRFAKRGTVRVVAGLAIGAIALTACGDDKKDGTGSGDKPSYTIAFQGPLSGDNAQLGINEDNSVKLAIEEANAKGDLPFTINYTSSDDEGSPDKSPAAGQKLIDDANVVAVIGPAFSGATAAIEPAFTKANLVSVSPSATRADLTSLGFKTFYRVLQTDAVQGPALANYVSKGLNSKSAYVVDDKSAYGAGLAKFVTDQLKTNATPFKTESIAVTKDYSAIATKIAGSGADVVVYAGYYAEFALFTKAVKSAGFKGSLISADGSKDGEYVKQGGSATEGVYLTCPCGDSATDPKAAAFTAAYKKKFSVDPSTYSGEAYDATNAVIAALKTAAGADGKGATRANVAAAVAAIDYTGITKQIKFEANGEVGGEAIYLYKVEDGKIVVKGLISDLLK